MDNPEHYIARWQRARLLDEPTAAAIRAYEVTQARPSNGYTYKYKSSSIVGARLDRMETYNRNFRLWHWRLADEQLIYSQTGPGPNGRPLYRSNSTRMLLACGEEDDFTGAKICSATQKIAKDMTQTPGLAIFLQNTGHSLDNEHPNFVARQIVSFLNL